MIAARTGAVAMVLGLAATAPLAVTGGEDGVAQPERGRFPQEAPRRDDFRGTLIEVPGAGRFAWRCTEDNRFAFAITRPPLSATATVTATGDGRRLLRRAVNAQEQVVAPAGAYRRFAWRVAESKSLGDDTVRVAVRLDVVSLPTGSVFCLMRSLRVERRFQHHFGH